MGDRLRVGSEPTRQVGSSGECRGRERRKKEGGEGKAGEGKRRDFSALEEVLALQLLCHLTSAAPRVGFAGTFWTIWEAEGGK
jgi:hypothetical protein